MSVSQLFPLVRLSLPCPLASVNRVGENIRASLPVAVLFEVLHLIAFYPRGGHALLDLSGSPSSSPAVPVLRQWPTGGFGDNSWDAWTALYARTESTRVRKIL